MRSWWGWGTVEDALSEQETRDLVARVAGLLPGHDLTDHLPPDPNKLGLAKPRIHPPSSLADLCSTDPVDRAAHAHGKAFR
ncbi:MAG TPA: FAD-binding oxidoreductase, partial [Mycobacterium sp.]|nr:FAD-binding oxidoreductase [Mycobacterium sp.]